MVLVAEKALMLMDAVAALLSVCDGAHSRDFAGFNGPDSQYFRGLLQYQADSTQWSEVTRYKVYSKLRKYRTQLAGLGINYDELPVVHKPASLNKSVELVSGRFVVSSPWNDSLINSVKEISGRQFDFDTKRWTVPANASTLPQVKRLAADYSLEVLFDDTDVLNAVPVAPVSAPKPVATISLLQGNILAVRSPYNNELRLACKAVRCYYEGSDRSWRIAAVNPLTVKKMADIAKQFNLTPDSAAAELFKKVAGETQATIIAKSESDRLASIAAAKAHDAEIEIPGIHGELRPFQKAGVKYSLMKKRTFVADQPGLGKTLQALATAQVANAFPVLVVCPASLKLNWRNEANKWLPQRSVCIVADGKPSKTNYDNADIVIINYDLTKKHEAALSKHGFKMIVCDESHAIKTAKTLRTKAVKAITKGNSPQYRLALTGTPVLNRPSELTSQLDFLGRLDSDFGGFMPFVKRYCNAYRDEWRLNTSGASNTKELNEKLLATCMVRRLKADVLKELPAKQRVIVPVTITNRKEYQRAEDDLIAWVQEQSVKDANFLASLEGLSQEEIEAACHSEQRSAAERTKRAEHLVRIEALKKLAAQGKMEAIKEWIVDFTESGQKLVVFAHHQDVVKELAEPFKAKTITGQTPIQARQDAVDGFQNKASEQVIVLNIQAGGVGLTLTAASDVIFTEYAWNPALMEQASDRCHRIGQEDTVTEWWFVAENTIDEDIINLLTTKQATVGAVVDGDENSGSVPTSVIDAATQALLRRAGK